MELGMIHAVVLPDVEMYGGDTQPWEIALMHDNGTPYVLSETSGFTATLTISPFTVSVYSATISPVVTKDGRIGVDDDGYAVVLFEPTSSDTISMRGKFIYQVAISGNDGRLRVGQGKLVIKPNNNAG